MMQMQFMPKVKLSYRDQVDQVWSVTKTKQDNNVTDRIGLVYDKFKTERSAPIRSGAVCDENQTGQ